ncbi:MAG: ABC transporter substrate-binding protein [Acidimicrobiia bacterium]
MRRSLLAPIALAVLVASCGGGTAADDATGGTTAIPTPGLPVAIVGADGATSNITDVSRIVTLSGEFSEIVWELGLGDNLVGVDLSSVYPREEMRLKPKIGVEFRILAEPVLVLEPSVVIGDIDASPPEVIEQVRSAGVPVVILPRFAGIDAPAAKIRAVAEVLGVGAAGEALATRVQGEIDAALALVSPTGERPRVAVVYVATEDTILMLGSNTVFDGILEALGVDDVGPAAGVDGFVPLTAEAMVAAAPEVIITAERGFNGLGGLDGFLTLPGIAQTPAGQNRRVLVYEDLYLLGLGPRTGTLFAELVRDLHSGD